MAVTPEEEDYGGSYLGLVSVLIVILGFLTLLVWAGVGPLKKTQEAANVPPAPVTLPSQPSATPAPGEGVPSQQAPGNPPQGVTPASVPPQLADTTVLTRIAIGNGIDQTKPIPILSTILARQPQAFILAGNAVVSGVANGAEASSSLLIAAAYGTLEAKPDFKVFKASLPIFGTWGNDDYGPSGASAGSSYQAASKEAFLQFYGVSQASDRAQHSGVYGAYAYGPEGSRVQIILLDTRTFRSDLSPAPGSAPDQPHYLPDPDPAKTMLGAEQWAWLEQQLIEPADVRLIVSPIRIESEGSSAERWGDLPLERDHLYAVVRRSGARGVVLVSGDQGAGAVYKDERALEYPLYEITSSGLNKPAGPNASAELDSARTDKLYTDANFGMIEIDWHARAVNLELRDQRGGLVQGVSMPLPVEED